jgi:hypothetical protein
MNQRTINYTAFAVLALLWLGFGAALLFNPEILSSTWQAFRGWHWLVQALLTLITLPVVLGLWVWQTSWPLWLRLILVVGLAWATLYAFFPARADKQRKAAPANADVP